MRSWLTFRAGDDYFGDNVQALYRDRALYECVIVFHQCERRPVEYVRFLSGALVFAVLGSSGEVREFRLELRELDRILARPRAR